MNAPRWWIPVPRLVRQLLIAAVAVLALSLVLGLAVGAPLFAVAPVLWLTILFFVLLHYHSVSRMEAWQRAKTEAWDRDQQQARQRSSAELHEELERGAKRGLRDGGA